MTSLAIRVRRVAASRKPRVAAALAAAALMAALTASLTGAVRQPITLYPVQAAFASPEDLTPPPRERSPMPRGRRS